MVIVKLKGGVGNQLFQYAAARRLSLVRCLPLKLDVSSFRIDPLRNYRLQFFNIRERFANLLELAEIKGKLPPRKIDRFLFRARRKLGLERRWTIIRETGLQPLNQKVIYASDNVYMDGYWQSEKYFADVADNIRQEFQIKYKQNSQNRETAKVIHRNQAVSIHIRRGDYVAKPHLGTCSLAYYQECVRRIAEQISEPHFFIFSDDQPWVKANLQLEYPMTFVTHNDAATDYEDLRLISMCQHHIIANSSFSWWGAWLNPNPHKIVFAPQQWFNKPNLDTRDLLPDGWIRV